MLITEDSRKVLKVLNETRTLAYSQIPYLFPGKSENAIHTIVSSLYHNRYISFIDNKYIVPYLRNFERESVICSWVMFDDTGGFNIGIDIGRDLGTLMQSNPPARFLYAKNNILFDLCPVNLENTSEILIAQKKFDDTFGRIDSSVCKYCLVAVTEDEQVVDKVAAMGLHVKNLVAGVHIRKLWEKPEIDYYFSEDPFS